MTTAVETKCKWLKVHEVDGVLHAHILFDEEDRKKSMEKHKDIRFIIKDNERAKKIKELATQQSKNFSEFYEKFFNIFRQ